MSYLRNIFNIPLSCSFWDTIAQIYIEKFKDDYLNLASALFLVPNRRACQSLTAAFVRKQGKKPSILPQIVPILEIDEDDIFFQTFTSTSYVASEKSTINKEDRLFLFARLISSKPADFGLKQISLAQAISLAADLANLLDTACNQGLSFDKLEDLVPEKYATHWQETLKLLKIITNFWPSILDERHAIDVCELKKALLYQQADIWLKESSSRLIVAAGVTANFPAIINLLKTISQLPNGTIYFAGIDSCADDVYWDAIDESHPQFELKEVLNLLDINRHQISQFVASNDAFRDKFISEIMRPSSVSDAWLNLQQGSLFSKTVSAINLIECRSQRDEALAIALKMREVLNIPEKTVALITYDRTLSRRVAAELERFDIKIDDSAGLPLSLSPIGIFLRLIIEAAENPESDIKFISFLKNPFTLCHTNPSLFRNNVYDYEIALRKQSDVSEQLHSFIMPIKEKLNQLTCLLSSPKVQFYEILKKHIELAEDFATSDEFPGATLLWRGDVGKCATNFITKMLESAKVLDSISGKDYLPLLCELMGFESVRKSYGTHPRLSILGPIEARLCHFDYVILGEFNEGIWPKPLQADMWMSRPMKKDFGFSLPEKNIGILAADLCCFLASEHVILTRAERVDGVPMKKSRWLLRIETVLRALNLDIDVLRLSDFESFVVKVDRPSCYIPIKSPAPCPPVYARPRVLSASAVDLLISDPYSVFAKYILKLYPLDDLDIPPDQRDYGTLIHGIIEKFNNLYPEQLPENALDMLLNLGKASFREAKIGQETEAFWWPKFTKTACAYIALDDRKDIKKIFNEIRGNITYSLPSGDFTFTAKADRIDILRNNELNIIDYKTGAIPTKKQIMSGHALQLLLEGLIASRGNFENFSEAKLNNLIYWHLSSENSPKNILSIEADENHILNTCEDFLLKLVSTFNFETTPYYSRPLPKYIPKNRDYEHLARIKEWSVQDEEEGNYD